jgi:hypothetical protein
MNKVYDPTGLEKFPVSQGYFSVSVHLSLDNEQIVEENITIYFINSNPLEQIIKLNSGTIRIKLTQIYPGSYINALYNHIRLSR